jgi:hypothetical protein
LWLELSSAPSAPGAPVMRHLTQGSRMDVEPTAD